MEYITKEGSSVEKDPQKCAQGPVGLWVNARGTVLGRVYKAQQRFTAGCGGAWRWHLWAFQPVIGVQPHLRPWTLIRPRLQKDST